MSKREHTLRVSDTGVITSIHRDDTNELATGSARIICRASDVEYNNELACWEASIREDGQVLTGYATRQEALDAEVAYLEEKLREDRANDGS